MIAFLFPGLYYGSHHFLLNEIVFGLLYIIFEPRYVLVAQVEIIDFSMKVSHSNNKNLSSLIVICKCIWGKEKCELAVFCLKRDEQLILLIIILASPNMSHASSHFKPNEVLSFVCIYMHAWLWYCFGSFFFFSSFMIHDSLLRLKPTCVFIFQPCMYGS